MKWYQVVLQFYASKIGEEAKRDNSAFLTSWRAGAKRAHLKWMCEEALRFSEADAEKACTWLGFVQGAFAVMGDFTIDDMRMHNKNAKNDLALDTPI